MSDLLFTMKRYAESEFSENNVVLPRHAQEVVDMFADLVAVRGELQAAQERVSALEVAIEQKNDAAKQMPNPVRDALNDMGFWKYEDALEAPDGE